MGADEGVSVTRRSAIQLTGAAFSLSAASDPFTRPTESRTALAAQRINSGLAFLSESGREGTFLFDPSDLSTIVDRDPAQGIYIPPTSDRSGASGAWVRRFSGPVNVRWFGAKGDGATDDGPAFTAALLLLKAVAQNVSGKAYKASAQLFVPAGHYYLATTTLDITHTILILGEGGQGFGAGGGAASMLRWADGTTGIRIQAFNTSGASVVDVTPHFSGGSTQLRDIYLYGGFAGTESEAHGIHAKAGVFLDNVMIENFPGDALHAHTSTGSHAADEGNSNTSRATSCHFRNSRNGVSLAGGDANAWLFLGCWFDYNRAWGVSDLSLLGNSYIGCHADGNGITEHSGRLGASVVTYHGARYSVRAGHETAAASNAPTGTEADNNWWYYIGAGRSERTAIPPWSSGMKVRSGGPYRTDNGTGAGSNSSVFVGNYSESGQGPSQFSYPTMIYGGTLASGVKGYGTYSSNYQGWWRVGSNGRGAIFEGSTTINGTLTVDHGAGVVSSADLTTTGGTLGYSGGARGEVEQVGSKSNSVALNKPSGRIRMHAAQLGAGAIVEFTVTNNQVSETDAIILNLADSAPKGGAYRCWVSGVGAGSFTVALENRSSRSLSDSLDVNFAVIKARKI